MVQTVEDEEDGATRLEAQAVFVRSRSVEQWAVEELLGIAGVRAETLARGQCLGLDDRGLAAQASGDKVAIQLLEAGQRLSISLPERDIDLMPHRANVLATVSGLTYTASEMLSDKEDTRLVMIRGQGGEEVMGPIEGAVPMPPAIHLLSVGGREIAPNMVLLRSMDQVIVADGDGVVEAHFSGATGDFSIMCRTLMNGRVTVSQELLSEIPRGSYGVLSAARYRQTAISNGGRIVTLASVVSRHQVPVVLR
jgi:hypothetical protein